MTFKQFFEKLAQGKAPGPSPSYSVLHLLLAVELTSEKPIGRSKLAEKLNVGEGTARTIVRRLKDAGLIVTSRSGCAMSDKGSRLWKECQLTFKKTEIGENELTFSDHNFAILIRNCGYRVKTGMEQRDAAVMTGAKGATTMLFKKGELIFPSTKKQVSSDFPRASSQVIKLLKPEEDDAIIIVSSDSLEKAKYGALAAAWTLLDGN